MTARPQSDSATARAARHETIGDLRRAGTMLEFVCGHCSVSRLFDPDALPFGDLQRVVTARRRMNCSFCGWEGGASVTRAVLFRKSSPAAILRAAS